MSSKRYIAQGDKAQFSSHSLPKPRVDHFFDTTTGTFTYVISDPSSSDAAIVDPVLDYNISSSKISTNNADSVLSFVTSKKLRVKFIFETHAHALFNFSSFDVPNDGSQFDHLLSDGEEFHIGGLKGRVLFTPGHTNDSCTFVIEDAAFIGDTLFAPDVGTARCAKDFPGGSSEKLFDSIQKILNLPKETRLFLCHDYPPLDRSTVIPVTSIELQKLLNIHLKNEIKREDFMKLRQERDVTLSSPKLLLPSIQLNINAGKFMSPEHNGTVYFKLPVRGI
ncbi:hypothetical protein HK096_004448 [Nowakowskiella sp. JEL0078]|nr:hypothetical protein HK096_004448 [Nowakowskiella sp. JEL0078]